MTMDYASDAPLRDEQPVTAVIPATTISPRTYEKFIYALAY